MTETITRSTSPVPFSPLTDVGLSTLINDHASVVVHAINTGRHQTPRIRAEAEYVLDLSRAHTDRALRIVAGTRGAA